MKRSAAARRAAWYHPVLSNIYLHKLDEFVERELIPQYTRGARRKLNPEYRQDKGPAEKARGGAGTGQRPGTWNSRCARSPQRDPMDPGYRRLRYIKVRRLMPSSA